MATTFCLFEQRPGAVAATTVKKKKKENKEQRHAMLLGQPQEDNWAFFTALGKAAAKNERGLPLLLV